MSFYRWLKNSRYALTPQQYRTLKGQANAGDKAGAARGLERLLRRYREVHHGTNHQSQNG